MAAKRGRRSVKRKSAKQVRFLLGKTSPLTGGEQGTLKSELRSKKVKIKKRRK